MSSFAKKMKMEFEASTLECPVCLDVIMDPPIFICENISGHSMCSKCHEGLIKDKKPCPVCREPLKNRRNITLENIVEGFPNKIECQYFGCEFQRSNEKLVRDHEMECDIRHVPCAHCDAKISLRGITDHLTKTHMKTILSIKWFPAANSFTINMNARRIQSVVSLEGNRDSPPFLFNVNSEENSTVIYWLSCVTPQKSAAKKYNYTLQIIAKETKDGMKIISQGTNLCVPCDLPEDKVRESDEYFVFSKTALAKAVRDNDEYTIFLTLAKSV